MSLKGLFDSCTSTLGYYGNIVLTPIEKGINDRATIVPALKFFAGIAQLINPGATLLGRVAVLQFANYADHFDNLSAIHGLLHLDLKQSYAKIGETCSYAFGAGGMSVLILRDVGLISFKKMSHCLKHLHIFHITPLKPLVAFGLDRIFLVGLIAGYSFSLYLAVTDSDPKLSIEDRMIAIGYYGTSIVSKVAMVSAGILFPISTPTLVILTTVAAGFEAVKKYRAIA